MRNRLRMAIAEKLFKSAKDTKNAYLINDLPYSRPWEHLHPKHLSTIHSVIMTVQKTIELTDEEYHNKILLNLIMSGWRYGASYDGHGKLDPLAVNYVSLTEEQREGLKVLRSTIKQLLEL